MNLSTLDSLKDTEEGMSFTLVIGASSKIARAIIADLLKRDGAHRVIAVSRQPTELKHEHLFWVQTQYVEESVAKFCSHLTKSKAVKVDGVFICNGILHHQSLMQERSLTEFEAENYLQVHRVNTLIPMLWLKYLKPIFKRDSQCVVTVFSARIGSIDDNERGGWYSYRASKAALNMLLKSVSIEVARSAKNVRFIVFHPGTTDTPLSKPFQKYVAEEKLFQAEFVAKQLLTIIDDLDRSKRIQFLAWDGNPIPW